MTISTRPESTTYFYITKDGNIVFCEVGEENFLLLEKSTSKGFPFQPIPIYRLGCGDWGDGEEGVDTFLANDGLLQPHHQWQGFPKDCLDYGIMGQDDPEGVYAANFGL